ncbi:phage tail protein [Actinobacillus pleuropneumoniae]|uniref:phage tail protein n=1 Tax=Actinobacillus pleuropneumoniae TaxID=715 RepID=UPI003D03A79A
MDTFDFPVQVGRTKNYTPKIVEVDFGDAYVQRRPQGLNNVLTEFGATVILADLDKSKQLSQFLKSKQGVTPFYFVEPKTKEKLKVVCKTWSKVEHPAYDLFNLTLTETL